MSSGNNKNTQLGSFVKDKKVSIEDVYTLLQKRLPEKLELELLKPENLENVMSNLRLCISYLDGLKSSNILVAKAKLDTAINLLRNELKGNN